MQLSSNKIISIPWIFFSNSIFDSRSYCSSDLGAVSLLELRTLGLGGSDFGFLDLGLVFLNSDADLLAVQ
jgi:hypothetical protein